MKADTIESLLQRLPSDAGNAIEGGGEYIRWRHQQYGNRRPEADNAMGMDPKGMTFKADDRHVQANRQKEMFFCQFIPIRGDLLITLRGAPQDEASARDAPELGYHRVKTIKDIRRTNDGKLIYCKVETTPDHSGQWDGS